MTKQFTKVKSLSGELEIPGDKSISHRSIMFSALANGTSEISHFLKGADCLSTISCFEKLGINIEQQTNKILVHGKGIHGLNAPDTILDCGNSGTTIRLMSGILSAQSFSTSLTGDSSIQKRPMKRIMDPLAQMGAIIKSEKENGCAPIHIKGAPIKKIDYISPIASAQVKSAILLAGLYGDGPTSVTEPHVSRNHTEIMLHFFGANVQTKNTTATILPEPTLEGRKIVVPGDISSAAFFIAAGLLVPNSSLLLKNVGINPTRNGILEVAKAMGGKITLLNENNNNGEPTSDILVESSTLNGTIIEGALIPTLIDEIPIIAIMAAFANGTTVIKDAAELKVKESNRLDVMVTALSSMGCDIIGTQDGMIIKGGKELVGATINSHKDHRIAMSFAIASLLSLGTTIIEDADCVDISYPTFYEDLERISIK
ncbi:MAG: 3-phosphoshikimate 1-carboxyvinyltransferase [Lachnospiraceae bacterium]